jgi:hypothetical protein
MHARAPGVVVMTDAAGQLQGYNIVVGGGMGRSHRNAETFPRLADPLGYVGKDDLFHAVKAIVATQVISEWCILSFFCIFDVFVLGQSWGARGKPPMNSPPHTSLAAPPARLRPPRRPQAGAPQVPGAGVGH